MAKRRVLIVEDNESQISLLSAFVELGGFQAVHARTGEEFYALFDKQRFDIVFLDLGLPDDDGLSVIRKVRMRSDVPIIVLTGRKEREPRIAALEMGADDYLVKPFDPHELVLRANNMLDRIERGRGAESVRVSIHEFNGFRLDEDSRTLAGPDGAVDLTRGEFNVLAALVRAAGRVLSRSQLLDAMSHGDESPSERVVDVLISRIRKKIEADPKRPAIIVTVPGVGYRFEAAAR